MAEEETFGEAVQKAREDVEIREAKLKLEKLILEARKEQGEVYKSDLELAEKAAELKKEELEIEKEIQSIAEGKSKGSDEQLKALADRLAEQRKQTEDLKKQEKIQKSIADHADNAFKRLTSAFYEETPETGMAAMFLDPEAYFGRFGDNIQKMLKNPMGITSGLISTITQQTMLLAQAQDQAVVSFRKNTGATGEFDNNIIDLEKSLFTAGVTSGEAAEAVQNLYVNVSDFTMMTEKEQKVLGETVAVLNELGVSAATSSKNIQFATKVLGMSAKQTGKLQRELFTFARELGVSVEQIAGDFATMGPQIAALGSKGVAAFKGLEAQAKSTGLQMQDLLNLTSKFDKFDTAAQSVGSLNALLGGPYLNTLELVAETDPSKRMEILKKRVDAAGLSFNNMDYYQRKALASAMGLNEAQLAMFMQGDLNKITPTTKSAEELIAMENQTAQFNTIMEELSQTFRMLAISFSPLITFFKFLLQGLQYFSAPISALVVAYMAYNTVLLANTMWLKATMVAETAKAVKTSLSSAAMAFYAMVTGKAAAENAKLAASGGAAGAGMAATGAGAAGATAPVGAFGGALSITTTQLGLAVAALAFFGYLIYHSMGSPSFIEVMGIAALAVMGFAVAMNIFGFSMGPVIPILLALGAAVVLIGAGIGMAAGGMSLFVNSLTGFGTGLAESMTQTALAIQDIVESINNLSLSKTVAIGAAMVPLAAAAPAAALAATAASAVGTAASAAFGGGETPAAAPASAGPPPVININLQIDGTQFKAVVNDVSVEKYAGGKPSEMYASIIDMIQQGVVRGV